MLGRILNGFYKESAPEFQRAHKLDPMSRVIHLAYAFQPFVEGRDEESLAELERVKLLHPDYPAIYTYESWIYWAQGNPVEALRAMLRGAELDPRNNRSGRLCYSYIYFYRVV